MRKAKVASSVRKVREAGIEAVAEAAEMDDLSTLVEFYKMMQKGRIAMGNRVAAIESGRDTGNVLMAKGFSEKFGGLEEYIEQGIRELVKDHPVYTAWLRNVRGMGPILAGQLLAMTGPDAAMAERDTISRMWAFAGLSVVCAKCFGVMSGEGVCRSCGGTVGKAPRPVKGEKLTYNSRLRTLLYVIAGSFLKSGSPFRKVYDDARAFYKEREAHVEGRPAWTDGHQHLAAMRKMMKVFLACYWEVYRTMLGMPVRALYVQEKLGHTHISHPGDFGEWERI